ncbi:YjdF family protein [Paenibacillus motobuensis]|uniref:YjdF family protein n=1 Tax=Paenibacillus TaxID=44249 RepID=UPI00203E17D8|nr:MULTISPECIES: YjdF family protein [Paenibacillus]MCM3038909.1 YjdF family protein [Paenibacillus lutimineralis]MCM3646013.1 YjdF family protein [Paenibacillus motobuensis]
MKLTVFFNGQFWVGVVENQIGSNLKVCQHLFGTEPKDTEILDFVCHKMLDLVATSRHGVEACPSIDNKRINPKRIARQAAKEVRMKGISTLAQEAIKLETEARKKERRTQSKESLEELKEYKYSLKRQKAKEKHRGR